MAIIIIHDQLISVHHLWRAQQITFKQIYTKLEKNVDKVDSKKVTSGFFMVNHQEHPGLG